MFVLCFLRVWDKKTQWIEAWLLFGSRSKTSWTKAIAVEVATIIWLEVHWPVHQRRHRVRGRNTQGSCSKPATFLQWWCTSICRKPTCQHHSCTSIPVERTLHHPHSPHKICVEHVEKINSQVKGTPPKFNSSPLKNIEKWWFHDYFSFWESLWKKGLC